MNRTSVAALILAAALPQLSAQLSVRGVAFDSLHGRPLAGAFVVAVGTRLSATTDSVGRFAFANIAPGTYRFAAQHDAIDALGMSAVGATVNIVEGNQLVRLYVPSFVGLWRVACGNRIPVADTGFVFGTVRTRSGAVPRGVTVAVSWIDLAYDGKTVRQKQKTLEIVTDSSGNYTLCGVPTSTGMSIRASSDSTESGLFDIVPLDKERIARRDLVIGMRAADALSAGRGAKLSGRVLADSGAGPLGNAEVSITDLGMKTLTNARGEYSFTGIIPGTHPLYVRRIGYAEVEIALDFEEDEAKQKDLVLGRVTMLDSVAVVGKTLARDEQMRVFEEHRKIGLGKFITAEELENARGSPISTLIRKWPSLRIPSSHDPAARDPQSARGAKSFGGGCKIALYLDGVKLSIPLDLVPPETLAGLEYYPGAASVPIEYARLNHNCGVILLHSRYKTGK